jgi:pimeloyl-ACP methyl ester carboxylesterase
MRWNLVVVVALVANTSLLAQSQTQTLQPYAAPGRMVDVGGRKLHLLCSGTGRPTVILMAGGGAYSIDWSLVQPKVANTTRVCSYDRSGLAWSDSGPADETVEQTVTDLHELLTASSEQGPYLLVGASIGGIYIRAYQHAFPADVAGLVFTNSSNQVGMSVNGKVSLIWDLTEDELRSVFPLPSSKGPAPVREEPPFDRLLLELQTVRLWLDVRLWEKPRAGPESLLSWRKEFLREFDETDPGQPPALRDLPVVVVSSNPQPSQAERQSRAGAAARLDFLSSNSVHITAAGSGHEIHLFQPDVLTGALLRAVSAIRLGAPLLLLDDQTS